MLEGKIQKEVIDYAARKGVRHIRMYFGPGQQTGWPDVLFLISGGVPLFIEFKPTGGEPTVKQQRKIDLLTKAGYACCVCDDIDWGKVYIDAALRRASARAR